MTITNDVKYIGVNDRKVDLFEGQYSVPNGISYNSYVILDEKIAVLDTVDAAFTHEWLDNLQNVLGKRTPDYLIIQHMEPDHSANIMNFVKAYPDAKVVSSAKAFPMMKSFFGEDFGEKKIVVGEGDTLSLGKHQLTFVTAPMVHWPEVIVTYDSTDKILFSAVFYRNRGKIRRSGAESFEKGRRLGHSNYLPPPRPRFDGKFGILFESLSYVVLLSARGRRHRDRLYLGLREYEKGGSAFGRKAEG